ncbi:MAG: C-terminal binding protein [Chloroflexota bacterium]|nr:C-terminal binding protein [Chloroflexota bacterium]
MDAPRRFLVVHADAAPGQDFSEELAQMAALEVDFQATRASRQEELTANLGEADVVLVSGAAITRRVIEGLRRCRAIVRYGVGVDNVDLEAAREHGIVVANVVDFCTEEVSNHALLLLLACAKRLLPLDRDVREGHWRRTSLRGMPTIFGQTLGIIGLGCIGRALARKAQPLGLSLIASDPYVEPEVAEQCGVRLAPLEELLRHSDYVSVNAPLTAETRQLIGARELALMKPTAVLINTARGTLVDEGALVEALRRRRIAGAGLDVFEEEPLPADSPLRQLDNVILTPHTAGVSEASVKLLRAEVGRAAADVLAGRWPRHVANLGVRPRVGLAPEAHLPPAEAGREEGEV